MDLDGHLKALPHGPDFRFIDELKSLEPGQSAQGVYHITGDEAFLRGHFPGRPMVPGVILAEAIAQLAGVAAQSDDKHPALDDLRLTALSKVKILGAAVPGQSLAISARVVGRMGNLIQAEGEIRVDNALICTAVVALSGS